MKQETVVAVFETFDRAEAAVDDLWRAGIAESNVRRHPHVATTAECFVERPTKAPGFWARLLGSESGGEGALRHTPLAPGATVVAVRVLAAQAAGIIEILDAHGPIDIDERQWVDGASVSTGAPATALEDGGITESEPLRRHGISNEP